MTQKKGQSTLEYIVLVTAVVVAVVAFAAAPDSPFRRALNTTFNNGTDVMVKMSAHLGDLSGETSTSGTAAAATSKDSSVRGTIGGGLVTTPPTAVDSQPGVDPNRFTNP